MTSNQSSSQQNPNDIFWLTRYAHNRMAPLFEQAKTIEPSLHWSIEITFAGLDTIYQGNHLCVRSHWDREHPIMFQQTTWLHTKADMDRFIEKLESDVAALRPLEMGIAA